MICINCNKELTTWNTTLKCNYCQLITNETTSWWKEWNRDESIPRNSSYRAIQWDFDGRCIIVIGAKIKELDFSLPYSLTEEKLERLLVLL
jgi:hypothetical protein